MSTKTSVGRDDYSLKGKRVYVAGHRGMVGSACVRRLEQEDCVVLTIGRDRIDLRDQAAVVGWMKAEQPDVVIDAAATVGGILANDTYPGEFLYDNLMIQTNLVKAAYDVGVEKLLFLGSSCIYPREAPQPIREEALLTGPLEKSNEWYAIAKIAGVKLCQAFRRQYGCNFISAMPSNLYGPNDYFHPERSHVVPALLRRFHEARVSGMDSVTCWGTGTPRREFLFVDDLADACIFLLENYSDDVHINVGTGTDLTIQELCERVAKVTSYRGRIEWDTSRPDGTMMKRMDVSRINAAGWHATTGLDEGLERAYSWFVNHALDGTMRQ